MKIARLFSKNNLEDTNERLELLEKAMRRLEEEWTDVYSKFRTLQMRVAKQAQRIERAPERGDTQPVEREESGAAAISSLSPRAQLIQKQILERRRQNGGTE